MRSISKQIVRNIFSYGRFLVLEIIHKRIHPGKDEYSKAKEKTKKTGRGSINELLPELLFKTLPFAPKSQIQDLPLPSILTTTNY